MTDGTLQKDFFGPAHYGASGGAINPRDPNLMIGEGCEWRLDPNSGKAACVGTIDRHLHGFATFREGSNGKLYLFTIDSRYGLGAVDVWERLGDANYQKPRRTPQQPWRGSADSRLRSMPMAMVRNSPRSCKASPLLCSSAGPMIGR